MSNSNPTCTTSPEYLALRKCYELVIAVAREDPGSLFDALFAKGYVTESARSYVRNDTIPGDNKARKLVDNVIDQIKLYPNVFHEFVETLKSPHYNSLTKRLLECYEIEKSHANEDGWIVNSSHSDVSQGNWNVAASLETTDPSFICPYCKKCSLEQYLSEEGCPEATDDKTLFPYLNARSLSEEDKMVLEGDLVCAARDLRKLFACTDTAIAKDLSADVTLVKNFALDLVRDFDQDENEEALVKASTIPEIILALRPYKSFLNYGIIESIVNEFGSPQNHAVMQKYVTEFYKFCERSAFEIPVSVLPKKLKKMKEKVLTVKLTKRYHTSLMDVVGVQQRMASILGVKYWALRICSIEEGCVCVRFLVPVAVIRRIFPLSATKERALRDAKISIVMGMDDCQYTDSTR